MVFLKSFLRVAFHLNSLMMGAGEVIVPEATHPGCKLQSNVENRGSFGCVAEC